MDKRIEVFLEKYKEKSSEELQNQRYNRFRGI